MSAQDSSKTLGDGRLGFSSEKDLDLFVDTLGRFERGEINADEWRTFRLLNGLYGQRQDEVHMQRVKIPQGILTVAQLHALADVAERWAGGKGHITTRQNVQFHFVKLADVPSLLERIAETGLTTKEACGNSVRNVTQCPYAGVSATEPFDPSPYAEALTRYLLGGPLSSTLPRKFKIAFGGCCDTDCVGAAFNDLGYLTRVRDGRLGFSLTAGGGLATLRRNGVLLEEFVPVEELFETAEAVVRIFHRTGDRKNRHKARLKFVVDRLGATAFVEEYRRERENLRAEGGVALVLAPPAPEPRPRVVLPRLPSPEAAGFYRTNVRAQKQPGFSAVTVKVTLGDLSTSQLRGLAKIAETFSAEGEVRLTHEQNVLVRWVRTEDLPALHRALVELELADAGARTVTDVTSCPGSMSCKLAVTSSRGLASIVQRHLEDRPELARKAERLTIKASGCPNSCGQHHVSGLGWQGGVKKIGGRAAPLYHLYVGGRFGSGQEGSGAVFGRLAAKVPGRRVGVVTERLIEYYDREKLAGEEPDVFFGRVPVDAVKAAIADLVEIDEATAIEEDFIDLGEQKAFEVVLGEGECAA